MAIMAMDTVQKTNAGVFCLALFCSTFTFAENWQFDPSIIIGETYSNNIGLSARNKNSGWVSQAGLLLDASYQTQDANFNLLSESTYAQYTHNHDLNGAYHTLESSFNIKLWPNGISLFGTANINNQAQNSSRNALADIVSADTVSVKKYNSGLEYKVNNNNVSLNSRISYRATDSGDNIGNREGINVTADSNNGNAARHFFWDASYDYQEYKNNGRDALLSDSEIKLGLITDFKINPFIRYYIEENNSNLNDTEPSRESNSYGLGVRWLMSANFFLDASYNKPLGSKLDLNGELQQAYIDAAIEWQPSARTSLKANVSERFYGESYGLNFIQKNKRLTNQISYVEDVRTFTRDNLIPVIAGQLWCPIGTVIINAAECVPNDGNTFIPRNYQLNTDEVFLLAEDDALSLNRIFNWQSALALVRTTLTFNASLQKRKNLDSGIKDENHRISFNVMREISRRSNVNLLFSYISNNLQLDTLLERLDEYRIYQLTYQRSINSDVLLDFAVSYVDRNSDNISFNYEESRISAQITKGF